MSASTNPQPQMSGSAVVSTPLLQKRADKQSTRAGDEPMNSVVAQLANLRERYLTELQTARNSVKKNFLR